MFTAVNKYKISLQKTIHKHMTSLNLQQKHEQQQIPELSISCDSLCVACQTAAASYTAVHHWTCLHFCSETNIATHDTMAVGPLSLVTKATAGLLTI